jgi:hypothetical protein
MSQTNVKSEWVAGNLIFYDKDRNVIATFDGTNCALSYGVSSTSTSRGVRCLTETILKSAFTDGGGTSGTYAMTGSIPVGAVLLGSKVIVNVGFSGDTSAALIIGDGSDTDRYNTSTINIFATAANGVESGVPSGSKLITTANSPTLTVTSTADFTNVAAAGSITVSIFYLETA